MLTQEQRAKLDTPLAAADTRSRRQGGKTFPYLPQFVAKMKLNEILGPAEWSYDFPHGLPVCIGSGPHDSSPNEAGETRQGIHTAYRACVRLTVGSASYTEVGYGDATEYGQDAARTTHENAEKEAVSDAFKRCAMNLGKQLGIELWDKDSDAHQQAIRQSPREGQRGGSQRQAAEPKQADEKGRKRVLALCSENGITDEERHRLIRFCTQGRTESTNEILQADVGTIADAIKYYVTNTADAETQLAEWEAAHPKAAA